MYIINANMLIKYGVDISLLFIIFNSIYIIIQNDKQFIKQFIENGGFNIINNSNMFNQDKDDIIIRFLQITSYCSRNYPNTYSVLKSINFIYEILPLFNSNNPLIRSNV